MPTREQIAETARKYVGTPFRRKGRLLGRGMDCIGLVLCVAHDLNLLDKAGQPITKDLYVDYSNQPVGTYVLEKCKQHLIEKPINEMQVGDVLAIAVPSMPCHVAIVTEIGATPKMIHAYSSAEKVCEYPIDAKWARRIRGCFSFPQVYVAPKDVL